MIERRFLYPDASDSWKWARLDVLANVLAHSGSRFESHEACAAHAQQSRYDADRMAEFGSLLPFNPVLHLLTFHTGRSL